MSSDATGFWSGWATERIACPVCGARAGARCDLSNEALESTNRTHLDRIDAYGQIHDIYTRAQERDEARAERDGAVLACSTLRREVKGVNKALAETTRRLRLLESVDRDPQALRAREDLRGLHEKVRAQAREEEHLKRRIGMLQKELRDEKAKARGAPSEESLKLLEAIDAFCLVENKSFELLLSLIERRGARLRKERGE